MKVSFKVNLRTVQFSMASYKVIITSSPGSRNDVLKGKVKNKFLRDKIKFHPSIINEARK